MIRAEALSFAFGADVAALDGLTFTVPRGTIRGVVGANGSGKSTLLALLAGLYTPTGGSLAVDGEVSPGAEDAIRRRVALVLQDPDQQIIGATVEEDLLLGLPPADAVRRAAARRLAARFGLADGDAPVHTLSLGSRRKLCIVTALRDAPEVLLLDEPFAGLDYPAIREMRAILAANRAAGVTQVVAAHDLEAFADLVDGWLVLERGRLVREGGAEAVFPELRRHGVRPPGAWLAARGLDPWA
ncbi:MAG TPA: ABC transporter ATP-binding protein [Anaeromyxobacteraceae bacterium]|nr:ABC transporter ATP-binding protein [Anaeromyxobacteraceae bacterium]